jgi:hypothetical protein
MNNVWLVLNTGYEIHQVLGCFTTEQTARQFIAELQIRQEQLGQEPCDVSFDQIELEQYPLYTTVCIGLRKGYCLTIRIVEEHEHQIHSYHEEWYLAPKSIAIETRNQFRNNIDLISYISEVHVRKCAMEMFGAIAEKFNEHTQQWENA